MCDVINGEKTSSGMNNQNNIVDDYSIYAAIPTNTCLPSFKVKIRMQLRIESFKIELSFYGDYNGLRFLYIFTGSSWSASTTDLS